MPKSQSKISRVEKHTCKGTYSDYCDECKIVEHTMRRMLDGFHSRQATAYLELLKTVPNDNLPRSGPELVNDYLEFLRTP